MRLWTPFGPRWPTRPLAELDRPARRPRETSESLTSAAVIVNTGALRHGRRDLIPRYESWQRELWDYYETTGEYGLAVTWRSNMISRVRLRAAEIRDDANAPVLVDDGVAADLVRELFADTGSQGEIMGTLSVFLDVPGEGWLVGETVDGRGVWRTYSSEEIRFHHGVYQVIDERSYLGSVDWRDLGRDSLVVRTYRPDKRLRHRATSPAKAARGALRELSLVNRHIQAQYLSRLASAGIVVLPDEITFPVREEFQDEADPFIAEWIETARQAIERPGTASAVIPIPMRVPGEYVDKIRHIDFTLKIDEKIIEKRDSARRQLASQINVPTELLFDAGTLNHWGLWQLEESGVKAYITPDVEVIAGALTVGYLRPRLRALGEPDRRWVVWYDASEITVKPDRSDAVMKAYDRLEVSGSTLRREVGLSEHDEPSRSELVDLILKKLAAHPHVGLLALHELTGVTVTSASPAVSGDAETDPGNPRDPREQDVDVVHGEPPDTRDDAPRYERPRNVNAIVTSAGAPHVLRFGLGVTALLHPQLCREVLFSCPFNHEVRRGPPIRPGKSGDYECRLSVTGDLVIGGHTYVNDEEWIPVTVDHPGAATGAVNGHTVNVNGHRG